jgi:monovalent cation:proton antiporter-2 (CPA2) family protein
MSFLTEALLFLLAALVVVSISRRLGLSSVLGYLAAGLIIGPNGFGLIGGNADNVLHFAEIGVVFLLFLIGLELQPRRLWLMRRAVFGLGSAQIIVTTLLLSPVLVWAFSLSLLQAGLVAAALALSSTAFVLQLLGEQKKLNAPHGRAAFGVLLMQDVAVIPLIAALSLMTPDEHASGGPEPLIIIAVLGGLIAARFLLRPLLRFVASTGLHELFVAAGLAIVVGAATSMQAAGLSMGLGAFIAGMMVADSEYRHQLETDITPFKGLLLGLLFIAVGMSVNLGLLIQSPITIIASVIGLVVLKTAVLWPLARWHGTSKEEALRTAVVLSQGGEFAFVLLTAAAAAAIVQIEIVEAAILVVTLSMVTTPFLVSAVERLLQDKIDDQAFDDIDEPENPVVIVGFGRFGQIVARVLTMRGIRFTALEVNPGQVELARRFGNKIYYGDATRFDLLATAHVAAAKALVIAVDDIEASVKIAEHVRATCPRVSILARARDRRHEIRLRKIGVHFVIRETLMSSLALTEGLLQHLNITPVDSMRSVEMFRERDAKTLLKQAAVSEAEFRQVTMDDAEELKQLFEEDNAS